MTDTTQELEQEIEAHRAGVEHTLERLKRRMSVDRIVDEVGQFVGVEDVRGTLRAAGRQVQDNPLALGLIGAGLAWLMLGAGSARNSREDDDPHASRRTRYAGAWPAGREDNDWQSDGSGRQTAEDRTAGLAARLSDAVEDKTNEVKGYATAAADRVRDTVDGGTRRIRQTVRPVINRMEDNPLVLGSVAVVVGTVIGSALPRTRVEDRWLGPQKHRLVDEARNLSQSLRDQAVDAARAGYRAAVETARDEGLVPSGEATLAEKVQHVAEAAIDEAKAHMTEPEDLDPGARKARARKA